MSTAFRRIRRSGRVIAAATLALAAVTMSACTDAHGKPNLFGIPLPSISSSSGNEPTERQNRQLELFDSTVRNPSADIAPETRVNAAEELILMDLPQAIERLSLALRSDEPVVVTAVIDAMEASPEPVPELLPAAAETLTDATDEQIEKLSLILPRYGEEALGLVAAAARDRNEPPARRVGPIQALASFRSRDAAVRLMALLQEQEPQPPEIIAATGASLEKLTGLPYGADADQWRKWWEKLKNEPLENWLRVMVLHLSTRTAELERESHHKTRENEEIALRLIEALRELFLSLTTDEQIERLPALLRDDLPYVREFALGRVELSVSLINRIVLSTKKSTLTTMLPSRSVISRPRVSANSVVILLSAKPADWRSLSFWWPVRLNSAVSLPLKKPLITIKANKTSKSRMSAKGGIGYWKVSCSGWSIPGNLIDGIPNYRCRIIGAES